MLPTEMEDLSLATGDHVVHFYESSDELISVVGDHFASALETGDSVVIVATAAHSEGLASHLDVSGVDVAAARHEGRLVMLDAATTLRRLRGPGGIDAASFDSVIGGLLREVGSSGRTVRVFGEMVALLWDEGDVLATLRLERCWNDLQRHLPFSLVCGYPVTAVAGDEHRASVRQVCRLHSAVRAKVPIGIDIDAAVEDTLEAERLFPADIQSPTAARRFVMGQLRLWGIDDVDDAALIVTELATNAVLHAHSSFVVRVQVGGGRIRLFVEDGHRAEPHVADRGVLALSGRGMEMVNVLASAWSAQVTSSGKVVWAELRR